MDKGELIKLGCLGPLGEPKSGLMARLAANKKQAQAALYSAWGLGFVQGTERMGKRSCSMVREYEKTP